MYFTLLFKYSFVITSLFKPLDSYKIVSVIHHADITNWSFWTSVSTTQQTSVKIIIIGIIGPFYVLIPLQWLIEADLEFEIIKICKQMLEMLASGFFVLENIVKKIQKNVIVVTVEYTFTYIIELKVLSISYPREDYRPMLAM